MVPPKQKLSRPPLRQQARGVELPQYIRNGGSPGENLVIRLIPATPPLEPVSWYDAKLIDKDDTEQVISLTNQVLTVRQETRADRRLRRSPRDTQAEPTSVSATDRRLARRGRQSAAVIGRLGAHADVRAFVSPPDYPLSSGIVPCTAPVSTYHMLHCNHLVKAAASLPCGSTCWTARGVNTPANLSQVPFLCPVCLLEITERLGAKDRAELESASPTSVDSFSLKEFASREARSASIEASWKELVTARYETILACGRRCEVVD